MRCPHCGNDLPEPQTSGDELKLADEIRTVTVLFADVAGSTEMTARLGLEAVKSLMDRVFERIYRVVLEHGGKVDKFIGDCVMALFGAPLAYGDDPARAVRAGLAILNAVAEMEPELREVGLPPVKMRIGINTGPVIAGPVGAGPERRYTVLGHAVNVAAHLQQEAPVGAVLVGHETFRRIRGLFQLEEHPTESGPAYLVLAEQLDGLWLRPREILGREIEMVGRAGELSQLMETARTCAAQKESRLVIVTGEPGIGKSRLAFEFLSKMEQDQPSVSCIMGFAHPLSTGVPFSVAVDAMRRRLGVTAGRSQAQVMKNLRGVLEELNRPSQEDLLTLARIVGLPAGERSSEEEELSPRRVLDLMVHLVDWQATQAPTVLLAEDLHWSDSLSLALLDEILEKLSGRPLLVVGFTRPELLLEHPEVLVGQRRHRIDLEPLNHDAVAQLVDQAVGPDQGVEVLDFIARRALGNPYHVEELLRALEERGVLVRRVGGWDLTAIPSELEIPPGVEAVTQARIDNLSVDQRVLLSQAAAVGRTFWDDLLRWLGPDQYSAQDLSVLVQRELVVSRQGTSFASHKEYSFVHDLTRDVAYRMLTEKRRVYLHQRIASWLIEHGAASTEELALVGRHLELGGRLEEAAEYQRRAGDEAFKAGAYAAAALHFSRSIALTSSDEQMFERLARRERVLNALGRYSEQRDDAERLLALAEGLETDELKTEALLRIGRVRLNLGEHQAALDAFKQANRISRRVKDPNIRARSLRWMAMYHFNLGEHLQARPLFEQALALAKEHGLDVLVAELAYELGVTVGTIGDYPQALEVSRQALEMFQKNNNRYQESFCLANIGCFHVYLGEYQQALDHLEQAAALGRKMRIPLAEASAQANLGNAYRLLGRFDEALSIELQVHKVAQRTGDLRLAADALIYGALASLGVPGNERAGDDEQLSSERLAREALDLARDSGMPGTEAVAQMALARVLAHEGELEPAVAASRRAVEILDQIGSVEGFEQEILLVHSEMCGRLGLEEEAERALQRAQKEIDRKASYISSASRRQRFVDQAGQQPGSREVADGS